MKKRKLTLSQIRTISLLIVGLLLFVLTIGYSTFNAKLSIDGKVNIKYKRPGIYIDEIINGTFSDGGGEEVAALYYDTEAHFQVKLAKETSIVEYDIVIQNNSEEIKWLGEVATLLNSNDSNIIYEITGFKVGEAIKPGESKTSHIIIRVKDGTTIPESPITLLNVLFRFETLNFKSLEAEFLSETNYGNLATNENGVTFDIKVTNPNPVSVNYYMTFDNDNFTLTEKDTGKSGFQLGANESITHTLLITLRQNAIYKDLIEELVLKLRTTYPISEDINIHTVTLELPNNLKRIILSSREIKKSPENFTGVENTKGYLMKITETDDLSYTYYYRGVIDNNYVSLAGYLWRIVRIDSDGNVRIVLNDNVVTSAKYSNNYVIGGISTIEESMEIVDYKSSDIRNTVEAWYQANIASHVDSKFVVNSNFCVDTNYQGPINTEYGHTVYYFMPYIHVGRDSRIFTPDFTCSSENIFPSFVGLLSAEEILAAGGYWEVLNDKYYLYNQDLSIDQTSWTISGSYYSVGEKEVGVIVFNQEDKSLFDWVDGGNLSQNYGYRPVISLDGNSKATGDGTKENPFQVYE